MMPTMKCYSCGWIGDDVVEQRDRETGQLWDECPCCGSDDVAEWSQDEAESGDFYREHE